MRRDRPSGSSIRSEVEGVIATPAGPAFAALGPPDASNGDITETHDGPAVQPSPGLVRRIRLVMLEGPEANRVWESSGDGLSIGSHSLNDIVLDDPTVSRFHCEVRVAAGVARVRDLGSRNGTVLDGVTVVEALLRAGSTLQLGRVTLRFDFGGGETNRLPVSERTQFGGLFSTSWAMRSCFALLERAAAADVTVLLEGETGTGKSRAAQAIHEQSARKAGPFLVIDCGAMPANLLESELFGHEKGAFTGAVQRRIGAFEEASGGTIFLDEIGELPQELQPKLLRVLENREIRRVGSNTYAPINVRVVAATNRDLRAEVNAGRFRSDLFFRLAVLRIVLPPLRQRPEDVPAIATRILDTMDPSGQATAALRTPEFLGKLARAAWPGNARELRNHLEMCAVLQSPLTMEDGAPPPEESAEVPEVDTDLPYPEARKRAIDAFEKRYVEALLEKHGGRTQQAAAAAQMDRVYLWRLLRRHGLKG